MNTVCNCGKPVKYSHFDKDNNEVMSCNKYYVCPTYEEQKESNRKILHEMMAYKNALLQIVGVNAMDYEYKAWAKGALDKYKEDE